MLTFYSNQEFIAKNLCEKKEEVENCCQGSCHLTKELSKTEEGSDDLQIPGEKNNKREINEDMPLFLNKILRFKNFTKSDNEMMGSLVVKINSGFIRNIVHPPPVIS